LDEKLLPSETTFKTEMSDSQNGQKTLEWSTILAEKSKTDGFENRVFLAQQ